jgi:DNA-binding NarL/FixJ family response regulator
MTTRVMIVDDHPMVAEGIQSILETYDDIAVVGSFRNGAEAADQVVTLSPDVVLLDLNMPVMGGLTATEIMLERRPDTRIVILSMHDGAEYVQTAMAHGARGYLLKDVPTEQVKVAIDAVMAGQRYLCDRAQGSLTPAPDGREPLTGREQAILLLLASGQSNKDVANTYGISVRTVETHRKNIKRKLGIASTAGLTRYAMEHGVLQGTRR